jgi:hypothetical protein
VQLARLGNYLFRTAAHEICDVINALPAPDLIGPVVDARTDQGMPFNPRNRYITTQHAELALVSLRLAPVFDGESDG